MPTFYTIWKSSPNEPNQPKKMNMTVADATKFITLNRNSLKQGEQYFTENQTTSEVDMMFTKRDTITPNKPIWLRGTKLVSKNPKSNPQKSMDDYNNPSWATRKKQNEQQIRFEQYIRQGMTIKQANLQLKNDELYFQRIGKKSKPKIMKPKKSRGKWVGNMFRLSNSRLSQLGKTGTPKQRKLAKSIIARRRKK